MSMGEGDEIEIQGAEIRGKGLNGKVEGPRGFL